MGRLVGSYVEINIDRILFEFDLKLYDSMEVWKINIKKNMRYLDFCEENALGTKLNTVNIVVLDKKIKSL